MPAAAAVTLAMNVFAGIAAAKVYAFGPQATANISTTLVARGEFALILATMAAGRSYWLGRFLPGGPEPALPGPVRVGSGLP